MVPLYAKSDSRGRRLSLVDHSSAVAQAGSALFGLPGGSLTRLGTRYMTFFGLGQADKKRFLYTLHAALWLHDLGKANDGFQSAVLSGGAQTVRHEHLSAMLLCSGPLREWLAAGVDAEIVMAAIAGHHLKAGEPEFGMPLVDGEVRVEVPLAHEDVSTLLAGAATAARLPVPPKLASMTLRREDLDDLRWKTRETSHALKRSVRSDEHRLRLRAAVRAALIAADAAGSAMVREGLDIAAWIGGCFEHNPLAPDEVEEKVLRPRINEIMARTGQPFVWHQFQDAAAGLGGRALMLSPCGSGKTLAAWRWVQAQAAAGEVARVIFLYPTRGTATEGFRDYVSWAGADTGALVHGTADFDLVGMFTNEADPRARQRWEINERLYALSFWPKRIFSATVDQFLGFLRFQYGSLCLLPVLADSVLVIDEVHSFDSSMFTALERFVKFFNARVLCMTATLPTERRRILTEECGLQIFPADQDRFEDLAVESGAPRYRVRRGRREQGVALAAATVARGGKVLWVVNTVSRCQQVVEVLADAGAGQAACYHSRYRLADRKARHEEAIVAFRRSGVALLVSTQVCEMSLDLDADVLITETAPVPSLIQRFGRCYRRRAAGTSGWGEVLVYAPTNNLPYEREELEKAENWISELIDRSAATSQAELAATLEQLESTDPAATGGYVGFLDASVFAASRDETFRDGGEFTTDCVLDGDRQKYLDMVRRRDPLARGLILPVPRRFANPDPGLAHGICVAPSSHYDRLTGFHESELASA